MRNMTYFISTLDRKNYNYVHAFDSKDNMWYIIVDANNGAILIQFEEDGRFVSINPTPVTMIEQINNIFEKAIVENQFNIVNYHKGDTIWNVNIEFSNQEIPAENDYREVVENNNIPVFSSFKIKEDEPVVNNIKIEDKGDLNDVVPVE